MTSRKLATIRQVQAILPIENADFIELVKIDGWQCVAKRGEFKRGDLCVYFEVDSYLPIEERYEFLRGTSYKKMPEKMEDQRSEGFWLKTVKLREQISQGLALPLGTFFDHPAIAGVSESGFTDTESIFYSEGSDVTKLLGVQKYESPVPANLSGQVKGMLPAFIRKTSEERIQNLPEFFVQYQDLEFECTEKIDGSSITVYQTPDDFGVCSRKLNLLEDPTNTFWKIALQLDLNKLLKEFNRSIALQGEIAGEGIQKNRLGIEGQKLFLFNVWDIDNRVYLSPEQRMDIFLYLKERVPIEHVPVVGNMRVFQRFPTMDSLLEFATDCSLVNNSTHREGVVFKSLKYIGPEIISFKVICNRYLLSDKRKESRYG